MDLSNEEKTDPTAGESSFGIRILALTREYYTRYLYKNGLDF